MNTTADHYFKGKNRHRPCEDYAVSGDDPVPYAILADGCSGSPGSHAGAMLLTLAARNETRKQFGNPDAPEPDYQKFGESVIHQAAYLGRFLNLPATALDTTLLVLWRVKDEVVVYVYGDGVILARNAPDHTLRMVEISFETNAPFYLNYWRDEERGNLYETEKNGAKILESDGEVLSVSYDTPVIHRFPVSDFSTVIIASDGLSSFADRNHPENGGIATSEIAHELTGFKNFNGAFIQRRARRAVDVYKKKGIVHTDDLSLAGIHIREAP